MAMALTQAPLVLFVGAKYDLLFGFNRTDGGFGVLLLLFVSVPLLNLSWLIIEVIRAFRSSRPRREAAFLGPLVALCFLLESFAIDLYIASHARM
jgi:hypothetical protein